MKLSEMYFKPKHEKIHVIDDFYIIVERITKPELNRIIRESMVTSSNSNEAQFKMKKIKTSAGIVEVSALSVELGKKIKNWEGLYGKTLKTLLPDLDVNTPDEEEIEYEQNGAIFLVSFGVIPSEDRNIPFEEFLLNHMNSLVGEFEQEVYEIEKKVY